MPYPWRVQIQIRLQMATKSKYLDMVGIAWKTDRGVLQMNEVEKLIARIGTARDAISRKDEQTSLDFMIDGVLMNCAEMLKEQDTVEHALDVLRKNGWKQE